MTVITRLWHSPNTTSSVQVAILTTQTLCTGVSYSSASWRGRERGEKKPCAKLGEDRDINQPAAAGSIFASNPIYASRVLDCLSHMTRVFVPVISTSISICVTEYHILYQPWWICSNRLWTAPQGNALPALPPCMDVSRVHCLRALRAINLPATYLQIQERPGVKLQTLIVNDCKVKCSKVVLLLGKVGLCSLQNRLIPSWLVSHQHCYIDSCLACPLLFLVAVSSLAGLTVMRARCLLIDIFINRPRGRKASFFAVIFSHAIMLLLQANTSLTIFACRHMTIFYNISIHFTVTVFTLQTPLNVFCLVCTLL